MMKVFVFLICFFSIIISSFGWNIQELKLPDGFKIEHYANVTSARQLAFASEKVIFVASNNGKIYAIIDENKDYKSDRVILIYEDFKVGSGIAFDNNSLYVTDLNKVFRFSKILSKLGQELKPEILTDKLPSSAYHGKRFLKFSPDERDQKRLFIGVGAPCNVCLQKNKAYSTILSLNPKDWNYQIYAYGVRNTVGFDWHPITKELWFTDNGRDWLGDNFPPDELNHAPQKGLHFGFPYLHGDNITDPEYGNRREKREYQIPAQKLGAHVASLGMLFYTGKLFPKKYHNQILIAEHGSWNRSQKVGYRISIVEVKNNQVTSYKPFITGWTKNESVYGRPVDLLVLKDGSLLISDDAFGKIYRVSYYKE